MLIDFAKRHGRKFLAWSCFAFVLAFAAWIGSISPSFQKCASSYEKANSADGSDQLLGNSFARIIFTMDPFTRCEGVFLDENNGTLTAIATIAVAAFTLVLWLATTEQGRLNAEALKLATAEFNATHRPKIIVQSFRPSLANVTADNKYPVDFIVINVGDSKAHLSEVGTAVCYALGPWNSGARETKFQIEATDKTLAPGESRAFRTTEVYRMDATLAELGATTMAWHCVGYVTYRGTGESFNRKTGFWRKWDFEAMSWDRVQNDEYEYSY